MNTEGTAEGQDATARPSAAAVRHVSDAPREIQCASCGAWFLPRRPRIGQREEPRCCSGRCRAKASVDRRVEAARQASIPFASEPCLSLVRSAELRAAILAVLADGQEHEIGDFTRTTGATWAAISPRLRDLRKPQYGYARDGKPVGYNIVRSGPRINERGTKVYRYKLEEP